MDGEVTIQDNWYTRLGIRVGATLREAETAYTALTGLLGEDLPALLAATEAIEGLRQPAKRLYHDRQIKWSATADWHQRRFTETDRRGRWTRLDDEDSRVPVYGGSPAA